MSFKEFGKFVNTSNHLISTSDNIESTIGVKWLLFGFVGVIIATVFTEIMTLKMKKLQTKIFYEHFMLFLWVPLYIVLLTMLYMSLSNYWKYFDFYDSILILPTIPYMIINIINHLMLIYNTIRRVDHQVGDNNVHRLGFITKLLPIAGAAYFFFADDNFNKVVKVYFSNMFLVVLFAVFDCGCWEYYICAKCTEEYGEKYGTESAHTFACCKHVIKLGIVYHLFITYFIAYSVICPPSLYTLFHYLKSTEDYIAVYEHQIITVLIYILCAFHTRFICRQSHSQSRQLKIKWSNNFTFIDRSYEIKDDEYDSPHDTDSLNESDSPNHESIPNQFEEDDDHQQHDTFDRLVGVV